MKALILAAGQGERLEHLTGDNPKALVKVAGLELIGYQLQFLSDPCITEIGVVSGYQTSQLNHFIKTKSPKVQLFENRSFEKGSILTLQAALPFLDDDFLLLNCDHIYPKKILNFILKQVNGITAACDFDRLLLADDMKVKLDENGKLKAIHKTLPQYDCGYIGLTYCPRSKLSQYQKALERTLASQGPLVSVEMILGEMAAKGETVSIANTSGVRWLEVDTLNDLKQAETTLLKNPSFLQ